jgi:hypothetical protein
MNPIRAVKQGNVVVDRVYTIDFSDVAAFAFTWLTKRDSNSGCPTAEAIETRENSINENKQPR